MASGVRAAGVSLCGVRTRRAPRLTDPNRSTLFVFGEFRNVRALVASDEPDVGERLLQSHLRVVYDLLLLVFGPGKQDLHSKN